LNWWYLRQKRLILSVSNAIVPLLSTFFPCGFIVVVFVFCREKLGNATVLLSNSTANRVRLTRIKIFSYHHQRSWQHYHR
jgi:hypothetical protein